MIKCSKSEKGYQRGDVLLCEEPFAYVLNSKLHQERCDNCFKRNQLLKCSGCGFVHYCDRSCQKNGWLIHKYECQNIKRVSPRIIPDAARLLARIVIKLNKGCANEKSYYTDSKFRTFKDLMSHYNEIKKDKKRVEHFMSLNGVLHEYLVDQIIPNTAELLVIYGKMVINTFNILDSEMQSIGSGLYLAASVVDHSCAPNAVAVFQGPKIFIRTLQDIPSLNWMTVFISYIELLNLPSVRQKELQLNYYFFCQCQRCTDIEELKCMTSTLCQNDECGKCILGGSMETISKCSSCGLVISPETKNEIKEVTKFTESQLEKMENMAYIDVCKVCLKVQSKIFHSMNIYKVKILDLALESCIALENWQSALFYGQQLLEPFRKYYGELHPLRGIFLMKLGKISHLLDHTSEANSYFKCAKTILLITHGSKHPLVKEELNMYLHQCSI